MLDTEVFQLSHQSALKNCITSIRDKPIDGTTEVIVRHIKQHKTLAQLGGLFGAWIDYLSNEIGESPDYFHQEWKRVFLSRIYIADHVDSEAASYPNEIDQWCELLLIHQESGDTEKLVKHGKRISLSWANLSQTKRYMKAIESHYQANGYPLPILDKFRKFYKSDHISN